jgi:hypothetical protein
MTMLGVQQLAGSVLWILGSAICLAAYSYARWWAYQKGLRVRQVIGLPQFVVPFFAGVAIFCVGMAVGAARAFEVILWLLLAILSAAYSSATWLADRRHGPDSAPRH